MSLNAASSAERLTVLLLLLAIFGGATGLPVYAAALPVFGFVVLENGSARKRAPVPLSGATTPSL